MTLNERIRQLREQKGWSQKELAAKLNLPRQSTVSSWETGRNGPNPTQREALCKLFNITLNELYGISINNPHPIPLKKIPVISWIHANKFEDITDPFPPGISDEFILSDIKGENIFALKVQNDCMSPRFEPGDIIIVNPHLAVDNDDLVVVADRDANTATFKQFKQYGNKKILHPLNPKYKDIELDHRKQYNIIGKVVAMQRKC